MEKLVPPLRNAGVRHHDTGFSARNVGWFSVGLVAMVIISGVLMAGLMLEFENIYPVSSESHTPEVTTEQAPAPLLQPSPQEDLEQMRQRTRDILNSYGWMDREAGVVRIPIERAMDLMIQRGFPVRTQPAPLEGPPPVGKTEPSLSPPPESPLSGDAYRGN